MPKPHVCVGPQSTVVLGRQRYESENSMTARQILLSFILTLVFVLSGCDECMTAYADRDKDGYGDEENETEVVCKYATGIPDDVAIIPGDCDDSDETVNPEAEELCNGLDDNCDGQADEGLEYQNTYYLDADQDGWGDPDISITACALPEGYAGTGGDCDDTDPEVGRDDC